MLVMMCISGIDKKKKKKEPEEEGGDVVNLLLDGLCAGDGVQLLQHLGPML
jgi:hypothetical protein